MRPIALTIAGSDPSGGAGIQADLKTFSALGTYGMAAITALTAQNTMGVSGVHVVPANFLADQLRALSDDIRPTAVKIGMVPTADHVAAIEVYLAQGIPAVLDPVMVATSGDRLVDDVAAAALSGLARTVDVVTPNVAELAVLLGRPHEAATTVAELTDQALELHRTGVRRVYAKGGHLDSSDGSETATDVWVLDGTAYPVVGPRVATNNTHGTGCTLSSAITAYYASCADWSEAVQSAKGWLHGALHSAAPWTLGKGHGPVDHLWMQP